MTTDLSNRLKRYSKKAIADALDPDFADAVWEAADVQSVVHGKNLDEKWPSLFKCGICHWSCWDTYCGDTDTYNYCPNCGARMDGKEDG